MASENPGAARVVALSDGTSHLIGSLPLTVGRDPVSDIQVDEEDVSRRHAYLLRTPQGVLLVDSSLHGTWVNGERMQAQRLLADRDVIQMGSRSFRFEICAQPLPRAERSSAPGELQQPKVRNVWRMNDASAMLSAIARTSLCRSLDGPS